MDSDNDKNKYPVTVTGDSACQSARMLVYLGVNTSGVSFLTPYQKNIMKYLDFSVKTMQKKYHDVMLLCVT